MELSTRKLRLRQQQCNLAATIFTSRTRHQITRTRINIRLPRGSTSSFHQHQLRTPLLRSKESRTQPSIHHITSRQYLRALQNQRQKNTSPYISSFSNPNQTKPKKTLSRKQKIIAHRNHGLALPRHLQQHPNRLPAAQLPNQNPARRRRNAFNRPRPLRPRLIFGLP